MSGLPSKIRRREADNLAQQKVYDLRGSPYNKSFNPYLENTTQYKQFIHLYDVWYSKYHIGESFMKDMREVYGDF